MDTLAEHYLHLACKARDHLATVVQGLKAQQVGGKD